MLEAIYRFIDSDYYDPVNLVAVVWGLFSLVMLLLGLALTPGRKVLAWTGIVAMVASIVFSMVFEDFLPGLQSGRTGWLNAVGMATILAGTVVLAGGGYVFARDTFGRLNIAFLPLFGRGWRDAVEKVRADARVPARAWLTLWRRGLTIMAGGFLLIVVGASLNNDDRFPLAWFWGIFGI